MVPADWFVCGCWLYDTLLSQRYSLYWSPYKSGCGGCGRADGRCSMCQSSSAPSFCSWCVSVVQLCFSNRGNKTFALASSRNGYKSVAIEILETRMATNPIENILEKAAFESFVAPLLLGKFERRAAQAVSGADATTKGRTRSSVRLHRRRS